MLMVNKFGQPVFIVFSLGHPSSLSLYLSFFNNTPKRFVFLPGVHVYVFKCATRTAVTRPNQEVPSSQITNREPWIK